MSTLLRTAPPPLACRRCGATVEVAGPAVERWAEGVAAEHGFTEVSATRWSSSASCQVSLSGAVAVGRVGPP